MALFFLTDTAPTDLLPDSATFVASTAGTQFLQRFRYRGVRETFKWNTFLYGQEIDVNVLTAYLDQVRDANIAATAGYVTNLTTTASSITGILAVFNLTQNLE